MVEVDSIRTPAQLRTAVRTVVHQSGLSHDRLAERSSVPKTTLNGFLNQKATSFPRWTTLEPVLVACGIGEEDILVWRNAHARAKVSRVGISLDRVVDPFLLGVHVSISADGPGRDQSELPGYVPRAHDAQLAQVVGQVRDGVSRIAILDGGSSTGKTRALWEALGPLRADGGWQLWHPESPTRRLALGEFGTVGPRTVVWLDELQEYLELNDDDEHLSVALSELITDLTRAPVLVLATLWPEHYATLTQKGSAKTRKLLTTNVIEVPAAFTVEDVSAARSVARSDDRLAQAVKNSDGNQIVQYLAGGPALIDRSLYASSRPAQALIEAAMDARRKDQRRSRTQQVLPLGAVDRQARRVRLEYVHTMKPQDVTGPVASSREGRVVQ